MKKSYFMSLIILLAVFTYAVLRYNVIRGTSWTELPLFISNKAFSLSAVVFIVLSYSFGSLARFWPKVFVPVLSLRKFFGLFGFGMAAIHVIMSLLIFSPAYYPRLFLASGKLNLTGELSMLFGVLAFFVLTMVALSSLPEIGKSMSPKNWLMVQRLGYLSLIVVFFHIFTMGFGGWLKPSGWPGGLLPISLIAAILITFVLLLKITAIIFSRNK